MLDTPDHSDTPGGMPEDTRDRRLGILWGLAIGDALGAAVEFKARGSFPPVTHYRSGGPWNLNSGEWTDDTSMALALAASILEVGWDLSDQARKYLNWRDHGHYSVNGRCFDIGTTTNRALSRFAREKNPHTCAPDDEWSAGNGSLMRLGPVPIAFFNLRVSDPKTFIDYCILSSKVTHAAPLCLAASGWMGLALCDLALGLKWESILSPSWTGLRELEKVMDLPQPLREVLHDSLPLKSHEEIQSTGYVVHSLEAAIWAVANASDFRTAVLNAVNLGGDADTIGAIAGQLAGARWGYSGIPEDLTSGLAQGAMLHQVASRLSTRS